MRVTPLWRQGWLNRADLFPVRLWGGLLVDDDAPPADHGRRVPVVVGAHLVVVDDDKRGQVPNLHAELVLPEPRRALIPSVKPLARQGRACESSTLRIAVGSGGEGELSEARRSDGSL